MESVQQIEKRLEALPKNDYYNRKVVSPGDSAEQTELDNLVSAARDKLALLIRASLQTLTHFDPARQSDVDRIIGQLKYQLSHLDKNSPIYAQVEQNLMLLNDLNKVNNLALQSVPIENTADSKLYCQLTESTAGVTEKIALVSYDCVRQQLSNLRERAFTSPADYFAKRDEFKLQTDAILKLPKHGDVREVQRESIALNTSRLLGMDTTKSSMVSWNDKPALFVQFEDIRLLQDYAKGETFRAVGLSGQTYQHYATIDALGDQLEPNRQIEDFGHSLGLFALCHDTDAIGGYIQNKALRNGKSLYIFDQVMMGKDKMTLDSRLSLQPSEFIVKHTRHGQGRNRSLIEDSSIEAKFASLMQLKAQSKTLDLYLQQTINQHNKELDTSLLNPAQLKDLTALRDDAIALKETIARRIADIEQVFPARGGNISDTELRQTLVLEKLMHNPVLFTKAGRPYRHPWTQRHDNPVTSVQANPNNNMLTLTFSKEIKPEMIDFIKRQGCGSLSQSGDNAIRISRSDLNNLSENSLHPELNADLNPHTNYLDSRDLRIIQTAYDSGHRDKLVNQISRYKTAMSNQNIAGQIKTIAQTERELDALIKTAKNPGFATHVLKKFHCDVQQTLQSQIPNASMRAEINQAFSAARRLDRMADFNHVLMTAMHEGKLGSEPFKNFLDACVYEPTDNHQQAKDRSDQLHVQASQCITSLSTTPILPQRSAPPQRGNGVVTQRFDEIKSSFGRMMSAVFRKNDKAEENNNDVGPQF